MDTKLTMMMMMMMMNTQDLPEAHDTYRLPESDTIGLNSGGLTSNFLGLVDLSLNPGWNRVP